MTSFLHLNVKDYVLVCICCTSQSGALLKFSSCKHTGVLANFIKSEIDLKSTYICNLCHNMLKKIEVFKQQVQESTALLFNQIPKLKINKLHNFQCSPVEFDSVISEIIEEVKPEYSECTVVDTPLDVKVESEASDKETEPVEEVKRKRMKKTKTDSKFDGKIGIVILNEQEVEEDRERMAKSAGYLKLPYKCEDCIVGFDHELTLVSHLEKRHRKIENGFQCNVCKSVSSNKLSHSQHIQTHIRRLECMVCHKRYNRMQSAVQHYDEQHAPAGAGIQQGYTCKECGFTTTSNRAYRYHLDKHKNHSCNICGNMFANSQGLKTHMFTVHKQSSRVYKCEPCNKSYRSRTGLEAHERSAHNCTDSRAFCVSCNTYYSTAKGLQQHLATHSKHVGDCDKRFICDDCGAKFATKSSLQMHINGEHFQINTHRCPTCTKMDVRNSYICTICHTMLKKIEVFKQQVEESTALLLDQVPILKINKLHNFQRSSMEIDGVVESEIEVDVKPEVPEPESMDVETDVKVEHDSSDNETEPLAELKKRKKKKKPNESKYKGKIGIVILSEKELMEERERMAKSEGYMKLPFKCEHCIVGFDHEVTLVNHREKRHRTIKNGYQCHICKSVLSTKFSYNEHTKRHVRRLECMVCRKRYNHMQSAVQHYDEQHAPAGAGIQQGYTCKECGFTTTSNRAYRYHQDKHKNKQSCDICGNTFVNPNGLKVHMYTVHKQSSRVYKCEQCNKPYRSRSGLEAHQRSAHGAAHGTTRAFCVLCKTHYSTVQGLQHHLSTHSRHVSESDKKFICDECGAKFVTKSNLQAHINWEHFKINTHRCTKCTKIFRSRNALNRHITYVHNKKRPPRNKICDYCGRAFTTQTILQSHIRTHTGERPLHCTHCPATFAHSATLYTHNKLLHTPK